MNFVNFNSQLYIAIIYQKFHRICCTFLFLIHSKPHESTDFTRIICFIAKFNVHFSFRAIPTGINLLFLHGLFVIPSNLMYISLSEQSQRTLVLSFYKKFLFNCIICCIYPLQKVLAPPPSLL